MPVVTYESTLRLRRGLRLFFGLRTAVTRADLPSLPTLSQTALEQRQELAVQRRQIQELRKALVEPPSPPPALVPAPAPATRPVAGASVPTFFLLGHGRSGTTWLQSCLDAHPEILCRGEGWFFNRDYRSERYALLDTHAAASSLHNALFHSRYLRLWIERSPWSQGDDADEHLDNLTRLAIDYFLQTKLKDAAPQKRIVGDKTASPGPSAVAGIAHLMPEAKVLHAVRDGRDVAVSVMHFLWTHARREDGLYDLSPEEWDLLEHHASGGADAGPRGIFTEERLRSIAETWSDEVVGLRRVGQALCGDNYHELRYERMITDPAATLAQVFAFLGAEHDPSTVYDVIEKTDADKERAKRAAQRGARPTLRFRKGLAGDWSNVFTEKDRKIFKEVAGPALRELGYEKDDDW